ncbi:UNVERIFIED_CONTAM: hypothetical protein K2H54_030948 [Gekko kuhli]
MYGGWLKRHLHSKSGHSVMDTWYDNPVPNYAPNNRIMTKERRKSFQTASSDTKEEGLEAQINRLAELIGRLENKKRDSEVRRRAVESQRSAAAGSNGGRATSEQRSEMSSPGL